jgi:hypothetical protein
MSVYKDPDRSGTSDCTDRAARNELTLLLLKEIMAEILSDEAVALAQDDMRTELRRVGTPARPELSLTPKLASLDAQAGTCQ